MSIFGANSRVSGRAVGLRISQNIYGSAVPYLSGLYRITPKLIWANGFTANKVASGKKGAGKKGGGSNSYDYTVACDFLLGHYPILNFFDAWSNKDYWPTIKATHTATLSGTPPAAVNLATSGQLIGVIGVWLEEAYGPVTVNDFGGDGPVTLSGTWMRPLWNEHLYTPDGLAGTTRRPYTYSWDPTTGDFVSFLGGTAGQLVHIVYAYQSATLKPAAKLNLTLERYLGSGSEYTSWPTQQVIFDWASGVGSTKFDLGASDAFPQTSLECAGGANIWPNGGADPADIITDLIMSGPITVADAPYAGQVVNIGHGLNLNGQASSALPLPLGSFLGDLTAMRNWCRANSISCSVYLDAQTPAKDVLQELFDVANCAPVWSGSQLKAIPYDEVSGADHGGIYIAPTASGPLCYLTDDDYVVQGSAAPLSEDRTRQADADNVVKIQHVIDGYEFPGQRYDYNDDLTPEVEQSSVAQWGARGRNVATMRSITKKLVAQKIASVMVKRSAWQRNVYTFSLHASYRWLEAMDLVAISDSWLGLDKQPVRLTKVSERWSESEWILDCEAEEFIYSLNHPTPTEFATSNPVPTNSAADPGNVNTPIFMELPDSVAGAGDYWLWLAISGAGPDWGGCVVEMSTDGTSYADVGAIQTEATMGSLTATLASHADPDNTNTLSVDLTESGGVLVSVLAADKDAGRSLCWVGGELISYQTATQTGAFTYDLTGLRRGLYGTTIGSHSGGTNFAFMDDSIFKLKLDAARVGTTIYFKLLSFNTRGGATQGLADVSPFTYVFQGGYNNAVQVIGNDSTIVPALNAGLTKISIYGAGGVGTAVTLYKSDGTTRTVGPIADFTGLAFSTLFYVVWNPASNTVYVTSSYTAMINAAHNGQVVLGDAITPNAGGTGGGSNSGGGNSGGAGRGYNQL